MSVCVAITIIFKLPYTQSALGFIETFVPNCTTWQFLLFLKCNVAQNNPSIIGVSKWFEITGSKNEYIFVLEQVNKTLG